MSARRLGLGLTGLVLIGCSQDHSPRPIATSGTAYQQPETQALQADPFANPGLLWVDQGRSLFKEAAGQSNRSCESCHADQLVGAATRLPRYAAERGGLINLEMAIQDCRVNRQDATALAWESNDLLSLSAYVAAQSNGMPFAVTIDGDAKTHWQRGRDYFYQRVGQLNLACYHCHERHAGQQLRGDTISQGQPTGYPAYRFEWQSLGSLHRRLQFCNAGVRAETRPLGDPRYLDLELYLAWRANELPFETPAVRR